MISDLATDARVWKEVRSLAGAGVRVKLIGCAYELSSTRRRTVDGVDVVEISLGSRHGGVSVFGRARTLAAVWAETLRTPARVYHCHNVHPAPAAWLASRVRGARLLYDGHELFGDYPPGTEYLNRVGSLISGVVERLMVRRSDAVVTTNPSRAAELERRHGRSGIEVLANVPRRAACLRPVDPGYPSGARVLLYQGGIYAEGRAFHETMQALTLLPDDIHFVILGFGRDTSIDLIEAWARKLRVADRVHLLGPRPFDELVGTAACATVGLVPLKPTTLNHVTGDTNKLHEYLMAGLPVVGSDLPEIRRVLADGDPRPGELFDPASPASIADAIRRVVDDPAYLRRREVARRVALERHNWEMEERKLLAIYHRLLGPPAPSPSPAPEVQQ